MHVAAFALDAFTQALINPDGMNFGDVSGNFLHSDWLHFVVVDPKGSNVADIQVHPTAMSQATVGLEWKIPDNLAGGKYRVRLVPNTNGIPPGEREFEVRAYRVPTLKTEITFLKKGYSAKDLVHAVLQMDKGKRAEVSARAVVDGAECFAQSGIAVDPATGTCAVQFALPERIDGPGEGLLSFRIDAAGTVENASKTIPILREYVDVDVYPEGGDLVAGVPCGLYIEAHTPFGDPADIVADIVETEGQRVVGEIATVHEGRGRVTFAPLEKADGRYVLRVTKPTGITRSIALPAVAAQGVSLRYNMPEQKEENGRPVVVVHVAARQDETVVVQVSKREIELGSAEVALKALEDRVVSVPLRNVESVALNGTLRVSVKKGGEHGRSAWLVGCGRPALSFVVRRSV